MNDAFILASHHFVSPEAMQGLSDAVVYAVIAGLPMLASWLLKAPR